LRVVVQPFQRLHDRLPKAAEAAHDDVSRMITGLKPGANEMSRIRLD
jgi:hypothetical protein